MDGQNDQNDLVRAERLRHLPVLRELPLGELDRLLSRSRLRRLGPKERLLREGEAGEGVFLVLEGALGIHRRVGGSGDAAVLAIRHAGEWVGESALLEEPRGATVRAEGAAAVLDVPREAFLEAISARPAAVLDLLHTLVARQRESDGRLIEELERKSRDLASRNQRLRSENQQLRSALEGQDPFTRYVGESAGARYVREAGRRAARSELPVLLLGETGTGKEILARAIHEASARRDAPFVALNCGLYTETLLESELFGHARGAFTGAAGSKVGLAEYADGGTLFLDELADMPPRLQVALLRFLEVGEFRRLGEARPRRVRVRVIAATGADLDAAVREGRFRRDLLYRLDVMRILLPPLRERRPDIGLLLAHFNHETARELDSIPLVFSAEAQHLLAGHDFPGNARELENEVRRLFASLPAGSEVGAEHLSSRLRAGSDRATPRGYREAVRRYKQDLLRQALREAGGSQAEAARLLGLHPSNLARMLRSLGVGPSGRRGRAGRDARREDEHGDA